MKYSWRKIQHCLDIFVWLIYHFNNLFIHCKYSVKKTLFLPWKTNKQANKQQNKKNNKKNLRKMSSKSWMAGLVYFLLFSSPFSSSQWEGTWDTWYRQLRALHVFLPFPRMDFMYLNSTLKLPLSGTVGPWAAPESGLPREPPLGQNPHHAIPFPLVDSF